MNKQNELDLITKNEEFTQGFNRLFYDYTYETAQRYFTGKTCLEIGPAEGYAIPMLLERFDEVMVIEGSQHLSGRLREQYPSSRLTILCEYIENVQSDRQFDTIIMGHVLEYTCNPLPILQKLQTWLSPTGHLFLCYSNPDSIHRQAAVIMNLLETVQTPSPLMVKLGVKKLYTQSEMTALVEEAGFRVKETGGFFLKPVSNGQMEESWTPAMIPAFLELGKRYPAIAAELYLTGERR